MGQAIRVGIAYNSCPNTSAGTNVLGVDYDLYVQQPSTGGQCAGTLLSSTSTADEVEMVFDSCLKTSAQAGTYAIRLRYKTASGFNLCGTEVDEPIAVVWDYFPAP
jgi:hypothetical protein